MPHLVVWCHTCKSKFEWLRLWFLANIGCGGEYIHEIGFSINTKKSVYMYIYHHLGKGDFGGLMTKFLFYKHCQATPNYLPSL